MFALLLESWDLMPFELLLSFHIPASKYPYKLHNLHVL